MPFILAILQECAFHTGNSAGMCLSYWQFCMNVPFILSILQECAFHTGNSAGMSLSYWQFCRNVPFILAILQECAFHTGNSAGMCLSYWQFCRNVPFILAILQECAFHTGNSAGMCLSHWQLFINIHLSVYNCTQEHGENRSTDQHVQLNQHDLWSELENVTVNGNMLISSIIITTLVLECNCSPLVLAGRKKMFLFNDALNTF